MLKKYQKDKIFLYFCVIKWYNRPNRTGFLKEPANHNEEERLMNKRKGIAAVLLFVMALTLLGGCAKKFDASGYTKSILDLCYKGETKEYMKLTESTKEEAEAVYTENLDYMVEEFSQWDLSDDILKKYRDFFADLNKNVKYTVGEAKEDKKGNFTVEVTVEPILNLAESYTTFMEKIQEYTEQLQADVQNGGAIPTEEEILNKEVEMYYDVLRESLDAGVHYGEAQTITVHVELNKDKVYEIPEADFRALDALTLSTDIGE